MSGGKRRAFFGAPHPEPPPLFDEERRRLFSFQRSILWFNAFLKPAISSRSITRRFPAFARRNGWRSFRARAARLRQLAALNNPIAGYLRLMAVLADAQQAVIAGFKAQPPSAELIASAQQHSMPLIPALSGVRDPAWHDVLLPVARQGCRPQAR